MKLDLSTLSRCQKFLSFCPQYNPIFDLLTVREHLIFFRDLKGNVGYPVENLLEDIQLEKKANEVNSCFC